MSRHKGNAGELEAAARMRRIAPNASRELNQPQGSPLAGRDLKGTEPFCVQVKRTAAAPAIAKALDEARRAVTEGYRFPIAMARGNGGDWIVAMDFSTFEMLASTRVIGGSLGEE